MENLSLFHALFRLNGFKFNNYPDFVICTKKKNIILLEIKGDDRDNSDSTAKNKLGQKWTELGGTKYNYLMVLENIIIKDTYNIDEIKEIIAEL